MSAATTGIPRFPTGQEYQPDYVGSGHMHAQPCFGDFADRIGRTWCFNPGAPEAGGMHLANVRNHIILDTMAGTAIKASRPSLHQTPQTPLQRGPPSGPTI